MSRSALLLALVACSAPPTETPVPTVSTAGVTCEENLGGPEMDAVVESEGGYRRRLDELDLAGLPATLDLSAEDPFVRSVVAYMLDRPWQDTWERDELLTLEMGRAVLGAVAKADPTTGELDFAFLRQGLHTFYACDRGYPATLAGFSARFGDYTTWERTVLRESIPKAHRRALYRAPEGGLWVAETLVKDGVVREVEIVLAGQRDDGNLDFVAYAEDGSLTNRSTFAMGPTGKVTSSSPYTCMACHVDPDAWTYDVVAPEM
jgi:hypothetical protein